MLVAGLSPQRAWFGSSPNHVEFVVGKMALEKGVLGISTVSCQYHSTITS